MKKFWGYSAFLLLLGLAVSCKKEVEFDVTASVDETVLMSANLIDVSGGVMEVELNVAPLDESHIIDEATQDRDIYSGDVEFYNYADVTFSLLGITEELGPARGNYSLAILMDKSDRDLSMEEYMEHMEAWNYFVRNNSPSDEYLLASFADSQGDTYKLFTDGFTSENDENVENLLDITSIEKSGASNMYDAISAMLDYVNLHSTKANKQIIVQWHNKDSVSSTTMTEVIDKANTYGISINFISHYSNEIANDFYYFGDPANIAIKTGGLMLLGSTEKSAGITTIYSLDRLLRGDYINRKVRVKVELASGTFGNYYGFYIHIDNPLCVYLEF